MAFRNSDYPLTGLGFASGQNSDDSSETSLTAADPQELAVYGGSNSNAIRKIDSNLNQEWVNFVNTGRVQGLIVDEFNDVYSAGQDNSVRKFDGDNGLPVWSKFDHTDNVIGIGTNRSGDAVVTGGKDNDVRRFAKVNGASLGVFSGHTDRVTTISVDSQGFTFSGSDDETVRKITPSSTQEWSRSTSGPVGDVAVDSNHVYYGTRQADEVVKIDKETGTNVVWTNTDHSNSLREVQLGPNGDIYSGGADNTVRRINSDNGNEVWSTSIPATVRDLTLDASGNVYVAANDNNITVLNGNNGSQTGQFTGFTDNVSSITSNSEGVAGVAMSEFTVRSTSNISGPTTIDEGDTENYGQLFNDESLRFSAIKTTNQSFNWSSGDINILSVDSGDFTTDATGLSDGTTDINQDFDDKYNTTSPSSESLSVTVQGSTTTFSPFSGKIEATQPMGDIVDTDAEIINDVSSVIGEDLKFALNASTSVSFPPGGGIAAPTASIRITMQFLDSSGAIISTFLDAELTSNNSNEFNGTLSVTATVPSNTESINLSRRANASAPTDASASATIQDAPTPQVQVV